MKKEHYKPVPKDNVEDTLKSLYSNRDKLQNEIQEVEILLGKGEPLPFEVVERINNLGLFIRNCAFRVRAWRRRGI